MTKYSPATGEHQRYSPIFNTVQCEKELKDDKHNSLHYLLLVAHSFLKLCFLENCSLLGTENVCGQNILAYFRHKWRLLLVYFCAKWKLFLFNSC